MISPCWQQEDNLIPFLKVSPNREDALPKKKVIDSKPEKEKEVHPDPERRKKMQRTGVNGSGEARLVSAECQTPCND